MPEQDNNISESPRRRFFIIGVFVFTILLIITLFSDYGIVNRIKLNFEISDLKAQIKTQQLQKDSLENQIKLLDKDPFTIEKTAREKFGMIKKNEDVFIILDTNQKDK